MSSEQALNFLKALDREAPQAKAVLAEPVIPRAKKDIEPQTPRPPKYPPVSQTAKDAIQLALRMVAGMCDGASTRDNCGFARLDVTFGKDLAASDGLSDGQAWYAARLVAKYHRQVPANLVDIARSVLDTKH